MPLGIDPVLTLYAVGAFVVIGLLLAGIILFTKDKLVSTAPCEVDINDDPNLSFSAPGGGTLLNALTSHGIPVPSPCGGKATCKQCRVQVVAGVDEPLETDKGTFTKKQLSEGWRLSCQTKLKHNIKVHVDEHALSVKTWEGTVVSNDNVATFIKELVVQLPQGEEVPYRSGGYLQFHVPPFKTNTSDWKATIGEQYLSDWEKYGLLNQNLDFSYLPTGDNEVIRAYSMASYPAEGSTLRFNIRIATPPFVKGKMVENIPWGICSSYTFALKPGDKVKLSGPYGESFMKNDNRELIFLIGGAGSSFGRSHILHLFNTENTPRKVTMWYGARSLKENIYQKEYEELDKKFDNFSYHLVLSEPLPEDFAAGWPKDDPTKTNFLFKAFKIGQLDKMEEPEENLYYVCGPPLHNQSVLKLLDDYGVPRENIVLDDFGS
jgi:Na+-transporting NADH:ubiquinone oxidoreductase subunit F